MTLTLPPSQHTPSGLSWVIISLPSLSLNGGVLGKLNMWLLWIYIHQERVLHHLQLLLRDDRGQGTWILIVKCGKQVPGRGRGVTRRIPRSSCAIENYSKSTWKAKVAVCVISISMVSRCVWLLSNGGLKIHLSSSALNLIQCGFSSSLGSH